MIYTLTLNPAMDKTVVIENLTTGSVNRIKSLRLDVGGKGINVSKCLKSLDCASTAAPAFIQPNIDELNRHLNANLTELSEIAAAAKEFLKLGIQEVVVSLGGDGALLANW